MVTVEVTFDSHRAHPAKVSQFLRGGTLVRATGSLNLKWEDFSALELSSTIHLRNVDWKATRDDSPSCLTLRVNFDLATPEMLERLVSDELSVECWELR